MCFIVAKDFNKNGCVALQMRGGREVVELKRSLQPRLGDTIQLVTISRPSAFGEYAPYTFAEDAAGFERLALAL